jgi:uncharacterized protein YhbP (UPF0306 family)
MTPDEILDANSYMTLATADADGVPWASPVWFAHADGDLFWISYTHRRHSRNITVRPQVAIVVFDSTVESGDAQAVYMEATASLLEGDERNPGIDVFSRRSEAQGLGIFTLADVEADNGLRLYRARVTQRWVLGDRDNRVPAPLTRS